MVPVSVIGNPCPKLRMKHAQKILMPKSFHSYLCPVFKIDELTKETIKQRRPNVSSGQNKREGRSKLKRGEVQNYWGHSTLGYVVTFRIGKI